jgi:hypothetical protein
MAEEAEEAAESTTCLSAINRENVNPFPLDGGR